MIFNALFLVLVTQAAAPRVQNVVVIVSDGVRTQEVFNGADRLLLGPLGGVENEAACVARFWRDGLDERRAALMPFLWTTMARHGQILGDAAHGTPMQVSNRARISYPGYSELFTGFADPALKTNDWVDNPNVNVFEWLQARGHTFVTFATWPTFLRILNVGRSRLEVHAGWSPPFEKDAERTPGKDVIDGLYRTTTQVFGGNALDAITYAALKESLKTRRPHLLVLGLGETDEWAHAGRYDLALEALQRADATIADLWRTLQEMPEYKDSTVLLVTTDHGRGGLPITWRHHSAAVSGAEDTWLAALGPSIPPLGVRKNAGRIQSAQVASTIARLLGESWELANPKAAPALPLWPELISTNWRQ